MWVGESRTGYAFQEELPISLVIFLLPSIMAVVVNCKFFRT